MHVVLKADGWNNNVKWGKGQSENCSVADSRQTQCMGDSAAGHSHEMGWHGWWKCPCSFQSFSFL